jgi:hypothetical protein
VDSTFKAVAAAGSSLQESGKRFAAPEGVRGEEEGGE